MPVRAQLHNLALVIDRPLIKIEITDITPYIDRFALRFVFSFQQFFQICPHNHIIGHFILRHDRRRHLFKGLLPQCPSGTAIAGFHILSDLVCQIIGLKIGPLLQFFQINRILNVKTVDFQTFHLRILMPQHGAYLLITVLPIQLVRQFEFLSVCKCRSLKITGLKPGVQIVHFIKVASFQRQLITVNPCNLAVKDNFFLQLFLNFRQFIDNNLQPFFIGLNRSQSRSLRSLGIQIGAGKMLVVAQIDRSINNRKVKRAQTVIQRILIKVLHFKDIVDNAARIGVFVIDHLLPQLAQGGAGIVLDAARH